MRLTFELVDSGETSLLNMGGCPLIQECLEETQEGKRRSRGHPLCLPHC